MNYKWQGKTPVQVNDKVELFDTEGRVYRTVRVRVTLASQFIASDGSFYLYTDRGQTWNRE